MSWVVLSLILPFSEATSHQRRDLEVPLELENGWEYQGCYVYFTMSSSTDAMHKR